MWGSGSQFSICQTGKLDDDIWRACCSTTAFTISFKGTDFYFERNGWDTVLPLNSPNDGSFLEKVHIKTHSHTSPESLHNKSTAISHHLNWTFQTPQAWYLWSRVPFFNFNWTASCTLRSQLSKVICHRSCSNMAIDRNSDPFSSKVCDVSGPKMGSILMLRTMLQDVPRSFLVCELDDFFLIGSPWRNDVLSRNRTFVAILDILTS